MGLFFYKNNREFAAVILSVFIFLFYTLSVSSVGRMFF